MTELHPRGVFCAALTPVTAKPAPDHARFTAGCRRLLVEGCDGIALPGTGVTALAETVALTRHALSLGVTTVVMLPPFMPKLPGIGFAGKADLHAEMRDP